MPDGCRLIEQYLNDLKGLSEVDVPMFDVKLFESMPKFELGQVIKQRKPSAESELNVLLISEVVKATPSTSDYNQVLDAIIRSLSNHQVTLFEKQKPTAKGIGLSS